MLQRRIIQALTDPAGHAHDQPVEIRADANAPDKIIMLRVKFPEEFQKVLAVCYRPNQLMKRSLESKRQLAAQSWVIRIMLFSWPLQEQEGEL